MTDEDALLAAVAAAPDDDAPRLAYADWLDEHGRPDRAEFIRVQCRIARGSADAQDEPQLRRRAAELLLKHREEWLRQIPDRLDGVRYHYRRGFAEIAEAEARDLHNRQRLYRFGPLVREVIARNVGGFLVTLNNRAGSVNVRLRARLDHGDSGPPVLMDLLRQAPPHMEPFLQVGRWLILCWAVWSGPDRLAVHRLANLVRERGRPTQVGIRPFDEQSEFASWCPIQNLYQCPIWLTLADGKLTAERIGVEPPESF